MSTSILGSGVLGDFVLGSSGEAILETMSGGITLGGEILETFVLGGGVNIGGAAFVEASFSCVMDGGVVLVESQTGSGRISKFKATIPTEGAVMAGAAADIHLSVQYDLTLRWRCNPSTFIDLTFLWNTGALPYYWYRVEGKLNPIHCEPILDCCQLAVTNVMARTVAELCETLHNIKWGWPIASVHRYTNPADSNEPILDENCNPLIPVEVCPNIVCSEFCIDADATVDIGFDIAVEFKDNIVVDSVGDNPIYVTGAADASWGLLTRHYTFESIGGITTPSTGFYITWINNSTLTSPPDVYENGQWWSGATHTWTDTYEYTGTTHTASSARLYDIGGSWWIPWTIWSGSRHTYDGIVYTGTVHNDGSVQLQYFNGAVYCTPNLSYWDVSGGPWIFQNPAASRAAKYACSYYAFTGGEWPYNSGFQTPQVAQNIPIATNYQEWLDVDNVKQQDANFCYSEVSYGRQSAWLIVKGFGFDIPDDVEVIGFEVTINRMANKPVRDQDAYLVIGEEVLSDNLAKTHVNWPTLFTETTYGAVEDDWRDETSPEWLGNWTPAQINDPEFGFAFRVAGQGYIPGTVAKIDYISLAVYYQDAEGQTVKVSGESPARAPIYHYIPGGKVQVEGHALIVLRVRYRPKGLSDEGAGVITGGMYQRNFFLPERSTYTTKADSRRYATGESGYWFYGPVHTLHTEVLGDDEFMYTGTDHSDGSVLVNTFTYVQGGWAAWIWRRDWTGPTHEYEGYEYTGSTHTDGSVLLQLDVLVGGTAICRPSFYHVIAEGGALGGGEAEARPFMLTTEGGVSLGGASADYNHFYCFPEGSSELVLSGESQIERFAINISPSIGGVTIVQDPPAGHRAYCTSTAYQYSSDGNVVFVSGECEVNFTYAGVGVASLFGEMTTRDLTYVYGEHESQTITGDLQQPDGFVKRCGCTLLAYSLKLTHNMAAGNKFTQFMVRSKKTMSSELQLQHSSVNDLWQTNLHYRGVAADNRTIESWNWIFELKCASDIGGYYTGENLWQLSVNVVQKNLYTMEDYNTRVVIVFTPDDICATNGLLRFDIKYNTRLNTVTIDPEVPIYQNFIYDNIGLFKNTYWINSPVLNLSVSQADIGVGMTYNSSPTLNIPMVTA